MVCDVESIGNGVAKYLECCKLSMGCGVAKYGMWRSEVLGVV